MRQAVLLVAALTAAGGGIAQDRGLTASADALGGSRWQARFERDALQPALRTGLAPLASATATQSLRLFGDYQLDALRLGQTGGLRLTGGLLVNLRGSIGPADPSATLPYAGIGYAIGSAPGASGLQWGLSADLGMAAGGLGLSLANRNGGTGLSIDGSLRDLRLQPMIRLGMNLSF